MIRPAVPLSFDPPTHDDRWWGLTDRQRLHACTLLDCMECFAMARTAEEGADVATAACDGKWSRKRLKDYWRKFRQREGDWQVLVPKNGNGQTGLPPAFVEYWRALCERHQRKNYTAWKELLGELSRWRRGDDSAAIPGYVHPPANQIGKAYPAGWSYKNLHHHAPEAFELVAARQGRGKMRSKFVPKVLTTRANLLPGQFYLFDDVWHDLAVNVVGQEKSVRPIELGAMDLFSGMRPMWMMKPILEDLKGHRHMLLENETLYLTAALLRQQGYRPEGTALIMERGTATIRGGDFEAKLSDLTGGAVRIEKGGLEGAPTMAGEYAARGKGNPRFKAALESFHNLMHNRMDALPGQVGLNPEHTPQEHYRMQLRNNHLLKALHALAEDGNLNAVRGLRFDLMEYHQFVKVASLVYERIHDDPDHNLEGWEEAGLITAEWRLSREQPFATLEDATPDQLAIIREYCQKTEGLTRHRKMTRREAWNQRARGLRKLPAPAMAALLVDKVGVERTVNDEGCFVFQDKKYSSGQYHFLARVKGMHGDHETPLRRRDKYMTVWNPLIPDELHVLDAKGQYMGMCPNMGRPDKADQDAIFRSIGQVRAIESEMLRPLQARGRDILRTRLEDGAANARLLDPEKVAELERKEIRKKKTAAAVKD
ncbi:MAG: hypothetical protein ACQKBU_12420, partial [Verrucomicrobiales bacterium]